VCTRFSVNRLAPSEICTLSLHDALPILLKRVDRIVGGRHAAAAHDLDLAGAEHELLAHPAQHLCIAIRDGRNARLFGDAEVALRSEEHTSELQSREHLVCRLLLERKKYY